MSNLQKELPEDTPKPLRKLYALAFFVAAFLGVMAYAIAQIPPISSGLYDICRQTHLCAPAPLGALLPLASGYEKGNTVSRAAQAQFEKYSRENPDWEICLRNTRSLSRHDAFNTNYQYRMEGEFYGVPKWRGLFQRIGDFFAGQTYKPERCTKQ